MPRCMKNPGQVSRFAATCASPSHQPVCVRPESDLPSGAGTDGRPASRGSSRTQSQMHAAVTSEAPPATANTVRQETYCVTQASGYAASSAPRFPNSMSTPTQVPNSRSLYHEAMSLSTDTNATATPSPTSARPASSQPTLGAYAKSSDPAPPTSEPAVNRRRGPTESASTPDGSCIAA